MRQELTKQLQTEIQLITKEVTLVRNSTETELNNCMQNFESESNKLNENLKDYKSQTDASMKGLRSVVNKSRDELQHKIDELTHEVRTVTSTLDEFSSSIQINKRNHKLEIQRLGSQIEELRKKVNSSLSDQDEQAVCVSPQTSSTI